MNFLHVERLDFLVTQNFMAFINTRVCHVKSTLIWQLPWKGISLHFFSLTKAKPKRKNSKKCRLLAVFFFLFFNWIFLFMRCISLSLSLLLFYLLFFSVCIFRWNAYCIQSDFGASLIIWWYITFHRTCCLRWVYKNLQQLTWYFDIFLAAKCCCILFYFVFSSSFY